MPCRATGGGNGGTGVADQALLGEPRVAKAVKTLDVAPPGVVPIGVPTAPLLGLLKFAEKPVLPRDR